MERLKRYLTLCGICAIGAFVLLLFLLDAELHIKIILGLFIGAGLGTFLDDFLYGKTSSKRGCSGGKTAVPKATTPKPIYIRKPFDNGFTYRIEWQHGRQYVFEGFSNKYVYRIDGDKIYRGSETKVYYQLKGNKVYRAFDYKDPVYRIEGDKIYQGNFGTRPVFTMSNKEY